MALNLTGIGLCITLFFSSAYYQAIIDILKFCAHTRLSMIGFEEWESKIV